MIEILPINHSKKVYIFVKFNAHKKRMNFKIRNAFLLSITLLFFACKQGQNNEEQVNVKTDTTIDTKANTSNEVPSKNEDVIFEEKDVICAFYNTVLKNLYPEKKLRTQQSGVSIKVLPDAQEDIEGGGESRKYLNILNESGLVVGVIIYDTGYSKHPVTLSMALLKEGSFVASPLIDDVDGLTILMTISNKNGKSNAGPYDFSYFTTHKSFVNPNPLLIKTKSTVTKPTLSQTDMDGIFKNAAFKNHTTLSDKDIENAFKGNYKINETELSKYWSIINGLKGVEKYYVQDNLFYLHSLLKYKKDERYKELKNYLTNEYIDPTFFRIDLMDSKNGYIAYEILQAMECTKMEMCYWNESNGNVLIGYVNNCCTQFCEGEISFKRFDKNRHSYLPVETELIIPEINAVMSIQPDGHMDGEGYDKKFVLPRNGENINYCVDSKCVELIWEDGVFHKLR